MMTCLLFIKICIHAFFSLSSSLFMLSHRMVRKHNPSHKLMLTGTGSFCHGTPCPPCPHAPNHLQSSPTPPAYTPVSLRCTLHKLAQPRHSCCQTKLGSMSNFPRLCPYVSGHHLFVFFSICHICLMHFH